MDAKSWWYIKPALALTIYPYPVCFVGLRAFLPYRVGIRAKALNLVDCWELPGSTALLGQTKVLRECWAGKIPQPSSAQLVLLISPTPGKLDCVIKVGLPGPSDP